MPDRIRPPSDRKVEYLTLAVGGPTFEQAVALLRRMATCELDMLVDAIEGARSQGRAESRRPVTLRLMLDLVSPEARPSPNPEAK